MEVLPISTSLKDYRHDEKKFVSTIRYRLNEISKDKNISIKLLSKETGISKSTLYNYFKNYVPMLNNLEKVLKAFDVCPLDFFTFNKNIHEIEKYCTQNNQSLVYIFSHNLQIELNKRSRKSLKCDDIFSNAEKIPEELIKSSYYDYLKRFYVGKRENKNISLKTMFFISYGLEIPFTDFFKEMKI